MTTPEEILQKTYDVLEERGWCQGRLSLPDGRVCLEGAFITACGFDVNGGWTCEENSSAAKQAWLHLGRTVYDECGAYAPARWNDHPQRTVEDVKLLLKKAIHD